MASVQKVLAVTDCHECGVDLEGRSDSRYCSSACRQKAYRDRRRFKEAMAGLAAIIGVDLGEVVRNAEAEVSRNAGGRRG